MRRKKDDVKRKRLMELGYLSKQAVLRRKVPMDYPFIMKIAL